MEDITAKIAQLSPTKQALLEKLRQQKQLDNQQTSVTTPVTPAAIIHRHHDHQIPLSFAQQRLWFLQQLEPDSSAYYTPIGLKIKGFLNIEALQQAFTTIVDRHESLRTRFIVVDEVPVQIITQEWHFEIPLINLSDLSNSEQSIALQSVLQQEFQRPFDPTTDLMLRTTLIRLTEDEHILLVVMHHIASDAWSRGLLNQELSTLYNCFTNKICHPLPELPIQYADFAQWQRNWLKGDVLESQLSYWQQQLGGSPPILQLPTDHPRPAIQSYNGASLPIELSQDLTNELKVLSQQEGVTLFMTLIAAFQILLYRYSGQEDIIVGTPIANRNRQEIEQLIGFFANTLALRIDLANNPSFRNLLTRVRKICLDAYSHQDLPFEKLVEQLQPERSLSYSPIFQVMFVLQNTPQEMIVLTDLKITSIKLERKTAKFDLTLSLTETLSGLIGVWEYSTDLFDDATIARMNEHFQVLLVAIVANPDVEIGKLPILTEREKHQLLVQWNDTQTEYPYDKCIHQLFEEQVERTPENIAVVFEDQQLTYQELNIKANQLSHYLRKIGVKSEVLVGICVERSLEMIIGLLGILKAGGAYVPIDPAYPTERLSYILNDTQISILLTQKHLLEKIPKVIANIVCLDKDSIFREHQNNSIAEIKPHNLAYVIYTSGSTGKPKGVAVEHQSVVNFLYFRNSQIFNKDELKVVTFTSSICFDVSVAQLFSPLIIGSKIIIITQISR